MVICPILSPLGCEEEEEEEEEEERDKEVEGEGKFCEKFKRRDKGKEKREKI